MLDRCSTAVTWKPAFWTAMVLGTYSAAVSRFDVPLWATLAALPAALAIAYVVARFDRGTVPATLLGVTARDVKKSLAKHRQYRPRFQLVSHPINHFGEKTRWVLDLVEAPYEETDVGAILVSMLRGRSVPWLVDRQANSIIGNSDEIVAYVGAVVAPAIEDPAKRQAAETLCRRTVETMRWEADLNALGHALQGFAYGIALNAPEPYRRAGRHVALTAWGAYEGRLVPLFDRCLLVTCYPLIRRFMAHALKLTDDARKAAYRQTLDAVLAKADDALKDSPYVAGDHFTYVDIALASLMGAVLPTVVFAGEKPKWARGRFRSFARLVGPSSSKEAVFPPALLAFEQEVLRRPVGKHVLRLFRDRRHPATLLGGGPETSSS
mmetsp:Transcript_9047/g.27752  ORF Transcript_9047/g.27752 Transcript_9047/m.27752 type:complete len:380 (-) Transcript_9047:87-1226(-)